MQRFIITQDTTKEDIMKIQHPVLLIDQMEQEDIEEKDIAMIKLHFPEPCQYIKMSKRSNYSTALIKDGEITAKLCRLFFSSQSSCSIFDTCSNVGGNAYWFAKYFDQCCCCELDGKEFQRLSFNMLENYRFQNINLIQDSCLNILQKSKNWNVIFFDPPWGGPLYKFTKQLVLGIDDNDVLDVIKKCFVQNQADLIVLKHPKNMINHKIEPQHILSFVKKKTNYVLYQLSFFINQHSTCIKPYQLPFEIAI